MPSLECFSKDTLWKIKKPTPPRNRGIPRENISRRRESTNKSRGSPLTLKVWQKCLNFSGTYSDVVVATPWLQRSNSCTFGGILASSRCSVTNSSSGLIFVKIRAESGRIFSKNPGKIRAKIRAKLKFLWVCRLFVVSVRSARYFAVWQTAQYCAKRALNHKNPGKIIKIRALSGQFSPNARISGRARIYPGDLVALQMQPGAICVVGPQNR